MLYTCQALPMLPQSQLLWRDRHCEPVLPSRSRDEKWLWDVGGSNVQGGVQEVGCGGGVRR